MITLALVAGVVRAGSTFFGFVSQTIYDESTAHLVEIFHQANQALYNLVSINWSRMRMWAPYLETAKSEEDIAAYVNQARKENNFTEFYFISRNGEYLSLEGQNGYLDLRRKLSDLILEKQPVVTNSVVPDKPEIMVFAVPTETGSYQNFEYEAIAITFNNSDMVKALKISAFDGQASTFAVLPDGRVVVDNGSEDMKNVRNILAFLKKSAHFADEEIDALETEFSEGNSGDMVFEVKGRSYYLVYEPANFQDWMVLGIVPTDVVNASMNKLQSTTMLVVAGSASVLALTILMFVIQQNRQKLKRKDNELLARDELFAKLSINVDDVFLMGDAKKLCVE